MAKSSQTRSATSGNKAPSPKTKAANKSVRRVPGRPPKNIPIETPDTDSLLSLYEDMLMIRRFEEKPDNYMAWA
jgi:hypothetical protein